MPVNATQSIEKTYDKWIIGSFTMDKVNNCLTIIYGQGRDDNGSYEIPEPLSVRITGDDLNAIAGSAVNTEKNVHDNIKDLLYQHLIDNDLIDDGTIA